MNQSVLDNAAGYTDFNILFQDYSGVPVSSLRVYESGGYAPGLVFKTPEELNAVGLGGEVKHDVMTPYGYRDGGYVNADFLQAHKDVYAAWNATHAPSHKWPFGKALLVMGAWVGGGAALSAGLGSGAAAGNVGIAEAGSATAADVWGSAELATVAGGESAGLISTAAVAGGTPPLIQAGGVAAGSVVGPIGSTIIPSAQSAFENTTLFDKVPGGLGKALTLLANPGVAEGKTEGAVSDPEPANPINWKWLVGIGGGLLLIWLILKR